MQTYTNCTLILLGLSNVYTLKCQLDFHFGSVADILCMVRKMSVWTWQCFRSTELNLLDINVSDLVTKLYFYWSCDCACSSRKIMSSILYAVEIEGGLFWYFSFFHFWLCFKAQVSCSPHCLKVWHTADTGLKISVHLLPSLKC